MSIKDMINDMADRAFSYSFLTAVCGLYNKEEFAAIEQEYQIGFSQLQLILSVEQKAALSQMEKSYIEQRYYAAQFGFKCGIFGAFRQFFGASDAKDAGFSDLVNNDLMTQPKMQRHHRNFKNIEVCNEIDAQIMESLSEEDKESLVSVVCAWQQRVYSAALDGFYCGYRTAYKLMESIDPLATVKSIDKILTVEYYLGYIKPYSEVERPQDLAA